MSSTVNSTPVVSAMMHPPPNRTRQMAAALPTQVNSTPAVSTRVVPPSQAAQMASAKAAPLYSTSLMPSAMFLQQNQFMCNPFFTMNSNMSPPMMPFQAHHMYQARNPVLLPGAPPPGRSGRFAGPYYFGYGPGPYFGWRSFGTGS